MIGKNIRSLRHLWRLSDDSFRMALMKSKREGTYFLCEVFRGKLTIGRETEELMVVLNNVMRWADPYGTSNIFSALSEGYDHPINFQKAVVVRHSEIHGRHPFMDAVSSIILLPKDYSMQYEQFKKNAKKIFSTLITKYCCDANESKLHAIYCYSNGSKNLFGWAAQACYQNYFSVDAIKQILWWQETFPQMIKLLSKGTITAYTSQSQIMDLFGEIRALQKQKRITDAINSFNTKQRKMLQSYALSPKDKDALSRFANLSATKKQNFITKTSSMDSVSEILGMMRSLTSIIFDWNIDSFRQYLKETEELDYNVVQDKNNMMVLEVKDYETIKRIAKTTNWCISKNKTYWMQYTSGAGGYPKQYVIFDFNKEEDDALSIIGFTIGKQRNITAAHNFNNSNLLDDSARNVPSTLHSYLRRFISGNIYSILHNNGIDIGKLCAPTTQPYDWEKESALSYFHKCVGVDNSYVLKDDGPKVAIEVTDGDLRSFAPLFYEVNPHDGYYKYILFFDFGKNAYDPSRIMIAMITDGEYNEEYCVIFTDINGHGTNTTFNQALAEFGLPYDTIKRPNDPVKMVASLLTSCDIKMAQRIMEEFKVNPTKVFIMAESMGIQSKIEVSITRYYSLDYLNFYYGNGRRLSDAQKRLSLLIINDCLRDINSTLSRYDIASKVPTEKEIESFLNGTPTNYANSLILFNYIVLNMLFENENFNNDDSLSDLMNIFIECKYHGSIYDELMIKIASKISFGKNIERGSMLWARWVSVYGGGKAKEFADKNVFSLPYWKDNNLNAKTAIATATLAANTAQIPLPFDLEI